MYIAFDVGEKRIGVALADPAIKVTWPLKTVDVTENIKQVLQDLVNDSSVSDIVVGRPLNQSGQTTRQTEKVEEFVQDNLVDLGLPIHWQEESLTSVLAEERLTKSKKSFQKHEIDAEAAAIILQDYLETLH
ncbi:MAG TPA: Holliday junction resolvase RuvX [Candidatus Saccharimonadales bacterium]|nr:Holliday junction resolvase RuvX [Candidatus Saccharimonadales bacterium]